MLNYIWGGMIIVSLIAGFFTGRLSETAAAALEGAGSAVGLCISLLAIMAFWTGLMRIAEKGGLVKIISKPLKPLLSKLFKGVGRDSDAMHSMIMNITANLLGMGNAATPLGIDATVKLHELNNKSKFASNAMCLFITPHHGHISASNLRFDGASGHNPIRLDRRDMRAHGRDNRR